MMPIARPGGGGGPGPGLTDRLNIILPTAVIGDLTLAIDHVVAVIDVAGVMTVVKCGASIADNARSLTGFLFAYGPPITLTVGRGSLVTPFVQGVAPLTPGDDVWASTTPGEVTQTAPAGPTMIQVRLGVATSATQMVINPDARFFVP